MARLSTASLFTHIEKARQVGAKHEGVGVEFVSMASKNIPSQVFCFALASSCFTILPARSTIKLNCAKNRGL